MWRVLVANDLSELLKGLIDEAGGRRSLLVGHNDELVNSEHRTIPREDVAEIALQSFLFEEAKFKSFDVVSVPNEKEEKIVRDWKSFFFQYIK
jgi:hypothetical protein